MTDSAPAPGPAPAEENNVTPRLPAQPGPADDEAPPLPPTVDGRPKTPRRRVTDRVGALQPATALGTGAVLGAALMGVVWLGTATTVGDDAAKDGPSHSATATGEVQETSPFTAHGTLTLTDTDGYTTAGDMCFGEGGYDDIAYGATVKISDAADTVVAIDSLDFGEVTDEGCEFPFTVKDIPAGTKFYTVEVSYRGGVTHTATQMREGISLTLG